MVFQLAETLHTPEVLLDGERGLFVLRGSCFPENSVEFFRPVVAFWEKYQEQLTKITLELHVELSYINSSSQRELYKLLYQHLQAGGKLRLIIYEGEEEEELEDLRHIVQGMEHLAGVEVVYQAGYYGGRAPLPRS